MTSFANGQPAFAKHLPKEIARTERGLAIAGTCITLYEVIDYIEAQYPPRFIGGILKLNDEQLNAALSYIEANRAEIDKEHKLSLKKRREGNCAQ